MIGNKIAKITQRQLGPHVKSTNMARRTVAFSGDFYYTMAWFLNNSRKHLATPYFEELYNYHTNVQCRFKIAPKCKKKSQLFSDFLQ